MKKINLNHKWMLLGCEPQPDILDKIIKPDSTVGDWMTVDVPGDVNATLLKYKKIPDPHYNAQAKDCYWVTSKEWWYRLEFDVSEISDAISDFCLTGVDGHSNIWLNDKYLGETKNDFRLFRFNITGLLKSKNNVLLIRFKSLDRILGGPRLDELAGWKDRRGFIRKPMFSFGWDWALPLPSIGLSGNVWIECDNKYRLKDFSIRPYVSGRVDFFFEVNKAVKDTGYCININVKGHGANVKSRISKNAFKSYQSLNIRNPQLWFPNGFGKQPLYDYSIELLVNDSVVDIRKGQIGFRESKIVERPFTTKKGNGFSFEIQINGETIFCKGANWVPTELWPANSTKEQYEFYLKKAKEANFNMIRVWGGGIYESDIFYDLCNKLGLMVWQDFMFASTGYPVNILRDEIIAEADYQIKRLRNHPCIVIWCGSNEDIFAWDYEGETVDDVQQDKGVYSEVEDGWAIDRFKEDPQIYTMILRGLVGKLGLGVPYIESSPQSYDDIGNVPDSGNCHISCWKHALFHCNGKPELFRSLFEDVCSFDSEFCIEGPCSEKTFKKFLSPENLWPPNDVWTYHVQRGHRNISHHEQTLMIAGGLFGKIDSLQKYVKYGQATHIEMMRAEYESARRDCPNNGGTMVWMLNDCWPTSNWSTIDYYRNPKPAFYAAKRACEPLLPIIFERAGKIEFFFGNDSPKDLKVKLIYGQEKLEGEQVWKKQKNLRVKSNSTVLFDAIKKSKKIIPTGDFLFIDAEVNGKKLPRVIYFPDGWKNINWPAPDIKIKLIRQKFVDGEWNSYIRLKTDTFVRFCHLLLKKDNVNVSFSDNYFDMSAGTTREICVQSKEKLDINSLIVGHWLTKWE
ncbi:MAG: hypothetical protein PHE88_04405 [Elusimicrobia bacterium]|nr:hypothetical protein [Elusimicrobiota bacterium]